MKKSTKTILASVLAMAIAVSPIAFEGVDKTEAATMVTVNYATNAVVTTSSNENAEYTGDKAVDGDMTTRWSSVFADNQWIMFDIGSVKTVGTVDIFWEAAYASRYTISWSQDNVTWYDAVITGTHGAGEAVHMFNKPARYVKITANQRGTSYGISIFEVKLIGSEMVEETTTVEETTESETVAPGTNLASLPSARAYASSEEDSSLSAANAIDGDMSTRWSSAWRNGESITVDLGKIYLVGTVTIFWEDAYASQYTISWSQDGVTWHDAVTMGNSTPGECVNWFVKPARYVKVTADKRGTQYGASIYELRLIGEEYTGQTYTRG